MRARCFPALRVDFSRGSDDLLLTTSRSQLPAVFIGSFANQLPVILYRAVKAAGVLTIRHVRIVPKLSVPAS